MSDILNLDSYRKAFVALEKTFNLYRNSAKFNSLDQIVQESVQAGLIQNFEVLYDFSVKMMRRALSQYQLSEAQVKTLEYKQFIRECHGAGLVEDPESWFRHRRSRNITSHTYDAEEAQTVIDDIVFFFQDAKYLLTRLESLNEKQ